MQVQLDQSGVITWVVNYTAIPFDSSSCSMQTTTTTITTANLGTTTTMQPPSASDDPSGMTNSKQMT